MEASSELLTNIVLCVLIIIISVWYYVGTRSGGGGQNAPVVQPVKKPPSESPAAKASAKASAKVVSTLPSEPTPAAKRSLPKEAGAPNATAAADAAMAAAAATKSKELFRGTIKRYSKRNGMGFISCPQTFAAHGVDVRIFWEEFEEKDVQVGDLVNFRSVLGGRPGCPRTQPWATDVTRSESGAGEGPSASTSVGAPKSEDVNAEATEVKPAGPADQQTEGEGLLLAAALVEDAYGPGDCTGSKVGLRADVEEFVPGSTPAGDENVTATPQSVPAKAPVVSSSRLHANAEPFAPAATRKSLNASAKEFVPAW